jgi:predicted HTH domain antitoxin
MPLTVTFDLPADLEEKLRAETPDLNADVREAYALELFRRGKLSHYALSQILGLDRFETDAYLKRHNVFEGSLTMEDLEEQRKTLDSLLGPVRQ